MKKLFALLLFLAVISAGPSQAATYYISPSGNDTTGTGAIGSPWKTFNKANGVASSGDTVNVRGGVYTMTCYLDKAGVTWQRYSGENPVVDGGWPATAAGDATGLPSGTDRYAALVYITASNVTWDGIEVRYSRGRGLVVGGNALTGNTVKNTVIHHCYMEGLLVIGGNQAANWLTNALIEYCEVYQCAMVRPIANPGSSGTPGTVLLTRFNGLTFRKNKVHDSWYDGVLVGGNSTAGYTSTGGVLEYNQIYGNYQDQLVLVSNHNNTVRYNLIYGVSPNANGENGCGPGIWFANETSWPLPECYSESHVYGNLIANTLVNMWVEGQGSTRKIYNTYWYNNTSVEATSSNFYIESWAGGGHVFKNNLVIQTAGTIGGAPSGVCTADYNLWSRATDTDLVGAHDATYTSNPLVKTTGWSSLTGGQLVGSEFALSSASVVPVDHGTTITAVSGQTLHQTLKLPGTDFSTNQFALLDQTANGATWEIGAGVWEVVPVDPCDNDGVCDSGETYLNCPNDCSAPSASHTEVLHFTLSDAYISGSTVTNRTAGGANGTIVGTLSSYPWGSTMGGARMFDGASYITTSALTMTGAWYITAWIVPTAFNTTGWDSHLAGTPYNNSRLCLSSSGVPQVITYDTAGHTMSAPSAVALNQPWFLVANHDGATATIYLNGALVTSSAMAAATANGAAFQIGAATTSWTDPEYFKGVIRDIRAGTGTLTAAEIKALYDAEVADLASSKVIRAVTSGLKVGNSSNGVKVK